MANGKRRVNRLLVLIKNKTKRINKTKNNLTNEYVIIHDHLYMTEINSSNNIINKLPHGAILLILLSQ